MAKNDNPYYYSAIYIVKITKIERDTVKLELLRWK